MAYRVSIDIAADTERVWAVLIDVERWPEWTPTVTKVERLESGMFRTGSSVRMKQPRLREAVWRVTSLTPQRAFNWTSRTGGVTTVARHVISSREEGGTRADSILSQNGPLAFLSWAFYSRLIRRYLKQESQGLKTRCEASEDRS